MPLPDFIIIGAGKCGTTSLWRYLDQSADVSMSAVKEPGFFSNDKIWARGLSWYSKIFHKDTDACLVGEASNAYSALGSNTFTLERMKKVLNNETKFIFCVRNPIKRTESDFMHTVNNGVKIDFGCWLKSDTSYLKKNNYIGTLREYESAFGKQNICIVFFEDLVAAPEKEVAKVCGFLRVRPPQKLDYTAHGVTARQVRMPKFVRHIQSSAAYAKISYRIPQRAKATIQSAIGRKVSTVRPTWSKEDFEKFVRAHEPSAIEFLKSTRKPITYWSFDQSIVKLESE